MSIHCLDKIDNIVGRGSTCSVFSRQINKINCESVLKLANGNRQSIEKEVEVLQSVQGLQGFPVMFSWNCSSDKNWIQMERLGVSVKQIIQENEALPNQFIAKIGLEMLDRVQNLHSRGYLHVDLKSEHFLFGISDNKNLLHLIDFGMSQKIQKKQQSLINDQPKRLVNKNKNLLFKGNFLYSSISRMLGSSPSIKDELESLVYIIGQMLEGSIPWDNQDENSSTKKRYWSILMMKQKQEGWKNYGWWIRLALKTISNSEDPYYSLRLIICKLFDLC